MKLTMHLLHSPHIFMLGCFISTGTTSHTFYVQLMAHYTQYSRFLIPLNFKLSPCCYSCILSLSNSLTSDFYVPTFWNRQCLPKCQHIQFRCWGITQKKEYNRFLILYTSYLGHTDCCCVMKCY